MAGNSQRRGAMRKSGSKKGQTVGSGGQRRRGLQGKGPTPKASERPSHPVHRRAKAGAADQGGGSRASRSRSGAREGGPEWVLGRNAVVEALRAQVPATALWVAERIDSDARVRESMKLAAHHGVPLMQAARAELDRVAGDGHHQGVVLQVPAYDYAHPHDLLARSAAAGNAPLLVALDGVTDPRNLGAVLRSAAAFGADGVVLPSRRAAGLTATAWKVSAGAAARVPVARATNLTRTLQDYRAAGLYVVGLDANASLDLADVELLGEPVVLVVGSEGKGLSRLVRETCDVVAAIPIASTTESLNAAVAAGLALYVTSRHRTV